MSRGEVCVGAGVFVEERRDVREEVRRGVVGRWGGVCDILGDSEARSTLCELGDGLRHVGVVEALT